MAEIDDVYVRRGLWTDWSRGPVMGRIITTDATTGTVVVSILALLISLSATHLWHLATFFVHQARASGQPSNGLFWQQQVLWRTQSTPGSLFFDSFSVWWRWRKTGSQRKTTFMLNIILPVLFVVAATAITLLTSLIVQTANIEILVRGTSPCFYYDRTTYLNFEANKYISKTTRLANSYRNTCYQEGVSMPSFCSNIFIKPRLPLTVTNSTCPFADSVCQYGAVHMDTGYLDLGDDFGLNYRKGDGVKFRKQTSCAVLPFHKYCKVVKNSELDKPITVNGPTTYVEDAYVASMNVLVGLFGSYTPEAAYYKNATLLSPLVPFTGIGVSVIATPNSEWAVSPELKKPNSDTTIFMIEFGRMTYENPVDDPLFPAHHPWVTRGYVENKTEYISDNVGGILACTEQSEYCLESRDGSVSCVNNETLALPGSKFLEKATPFQKVAIDRLFSFGDFAPIYLAYHGGWNISDDMLLPSVPNDQWIIESKHLMTFNLAFMQIMLADFALDMEPNLADPRAARPPPMTQAQRDLCYAQKMRKAGGFVNINFFGLVFVSVISTFTVAIDFFLLKILIRISNVRNSLSFQSRLNRWIQDGPLQLQRRAFEGQGQGTWLGLENEIPITSTNELLEELQTQSIQKHSIVDEGKETAVSQSSDENCFQPLILDLQQDDDDLFIIEEQEEQLSNGDTALSTATETEELETHETRPDSEYIDNTTLPNVNPTSSTPVRPS